MDWHQDAVFYELRVRSFAPSGDFKGLAARLDYLKALGVDCLWLLPIHPSPLCDDGYDVADYFSVHPDYGTLEDFKAFLDAARRRGLRVVLDLVLNHTSDQHPWFLQSRSAKGSPMRDWYVWRDTDKGYPEAPVIFNSAETSNWAFDPATGQFYWHRFFRSQPDLNFDNPEVRAMMLGVADYWLMMGVDGFRLDAVPVLFEREGTDCRDLPETHAYLKWLRRYVDGRYKDRLLLAEAVGAPAHIRPYFGDGDECHMAFNFPLSAAVFLALARGEAAPVREALAAVPELPRDGQWGLFLRNHDELGLSFLPPSDRAAMTSRYAPAPGMSLNGHIRRRLAPMLEDDPRRLRLVHALTFALPGTPVLYYGDELGMGEDLSLPDRFGLRTPMDWARVAEQEKDAASLLQWVRKALKLRRSEPAFTRGVLGWLPVRDRAALAFLRRPASGKTLVALYNLGDAPITERLELPGSEGVLVTDLWAGRSWPSSGSLELELGPYEFRWVLAQQELSPAAAPADARSASPAAG